jgi:hypothetical protein|tara:strand:- start:1382 stop:1591 length:210 start_codon:yes stop_codon:yes gene_type:complete
MKSDKNWIKGAIKKPGAFTAQRDRYNKANPTKRNISTSQFANKVLKPGSSYSGTTKRRANLAKTLGKMR